MERAGLIGVDTNVLLRVFLQEHPEQALIARGMMSARTSTDPAWVSLIVLCEFAWVLARTYRQSRAEIAKSVSAVLNTKIFRVEYESVAVSALRHYASSRADFGDCCIAALAAAAGCEYTVTFDKEAAKLPGMRLLGGPAA